MVIHFLLCLFSFLFSAMGCQVNEDNALCCFLSVLLHFFPCVARTMSAQCTKKFNSVFIVFTYLVTKNITVDSLASSTESLFMYLYYSGFYYSFAVTFYCCGIYVSVHPHPNVSVSCGPFLLQEHFNLRCRVLMKTPVQVWMELMCEILCFMTLSTFVSRSCFFLLFMFVITSCNFLYMIFI